MNSSSDTSPNEPQSNKELESIPSHDVANPLKGRAIIQEYLFWFALAIFSLVPFIFRAFARGWFNRELIEDNLGLLCFSFAVYCFPWFFHALFGFYPLQALKKVVTRLVENDSKVTASSREDIDNSLVIEGQNNTIYFSSSENLRDSVTGVGTPVYVESVLREHIRISNILSNKIYTRAGIYLGVGVIIAFSGLAFFYSSNSTAVSRSEINMVKAAVSEVEGNHSVSNIPSNEILNEMIEISPRFGILFFIEFIAFFFLRLYRNAMDEFRYFESVQRFREDSLVLFLMCQYESPNSNFEKIIERYSQVPNLGKILKDESTELIEIRKNQKDELAVFEQIAEIVKAVKK